MYDLSYVLNFAVFFRDPSLKADYILKYISDLELGKRKLQKPQVVKSNPLTFVFNYQNTQVTEVL